MPTSDTPEARNERADLHPRFEALVGAIFERASKARGLLAATPRATSSPLSAILESHAPRHVSVIVDQMRRATEAHLSPYYARGSGWFAGVDSHVIASALASDANAAYPLMTVWSGHVREAAVRSIAKVSGPFRLALLVHRLNDWVPQVRAAAEARLLALRNSLDTATVAGCIEFLWDFGRVGRASTTAREIVGYLVARPDVISALRRKVLVEATDRASLLVRRLLRTPALDDDLLRLATESPHPHVRAICTRSLLTQTYRWPEGSAFRQRAINREIDFQELARTALTDRTAVVQLAGLQYVVDSGQAWNEHESILLQYAMSSRNSLAELAQWALKSKGIDWVGRLREQSFGASGLTRQAAYVLGRFGDAEDGERIWSSAATLPDDLALPLLAASARQKVTPAIERLRHIALKGELRLARRASTVLLEAGFAFDVEALKGIADRGDEFIARGLGRHFTSLNAVAQLNILARLERAQTDFDLTSWFAITQRKMSPTPFTASEGESSELRELLADAPITRDKALRLLAIGLH